MTRSDCCRGRLCRGRQDWGLRNVRISDYVSGRRRGGRGSGRRFQIQAKYIRVIGFDITNHNLTAPDGYGIYLVGSNTYIANNYIHDLYFEGMMMSGDGDPNSARTSNNVLINNRFFHCEMAAAHIEGRNNLIEGNDVAGTVQYPPGGPVRPKADADALRFFGSGHVFRSNYIHDIYNGTSENPALISTVFRPAGTGREHHDRAKLLRVARGW